MERALFDSSGCQHNIKVEQVDVSTVMLIKPSENKTPLSEETKIACCFVFALQLYVTGLVGGWTLDSSIVHL